jgi:hypothetical protein
MNAVKIVKEGAGYSSSHFKIRLHIEAGMAELLKPAAAYTPRVVANLGIGCVTLFQQETSAMSQVTEMYVKYSSRSLCV